MSRAYRDRLVILESTKGPDGTTRYVDQVVTFADPRFRFRYMSARNLLKRADVFHVHWPEVLVRGGSRYETWARCVLLRVALRVMAWRKTAIVRTLHNLTPHESGNSHERRALQLLDDATDLFVTINPVTQAPRDPSVLIPHGHYRDRFAHFPHSDAVPGRLAYAGIIRPYKGVEQLLRAFRETESPALSLHLVGKPTPELRVAIETAAAGDLRIHATFGFVPDEVLVSELNASTLVCLPYAELHNSGMMLVALSLGRPVLVPDTETTRVLADEVGDGWVHRFTGELSGDLLEETLDKISASPQSGRPRLDDRDWQVVASRYGDAFDAAHRLKYEVR